MPEAPRVDLTKLLPKVLGETPEGHLYLVMPFLAGEPLTMREVRNGPLPVSEGIPVLIHICRGLGHAHGLDSLQ